jgi:hypothetical protein
MFWDTPDGGRPSNFHNRMSYAVQFIQFNICRPRHLEALLHGPDGREWHSLFGRPRPPIEPDADFGGLICVHVARTTVWSPVRQRTRPGPPKSS